MTQLTERPITNAPRKPGSRRRWILAGLLLLGVLLAAGVGSWYTGTSAFRNRVRDRVIADLEQVTGGRVELGSLTWNLRGLVFEARDLTIHGREASGEIPYAHADRLLVRAKILSLLRAQIGLRYLELDRPVVHLIVYPDGSTNQPAPRRRSTAGSSIGQLFELKVSRAEVREGRLLLHDRVYPLDVSAENIGFALSLAAQGRYDGQLEFQNAAWRRDKAGSAVLSLATRFSLWRDRLQVSSLQVASGRSRLDASGELRNFDHPVADFTYTTLLDLGQLGRMLQVPELRAGTLRLDGKGSADSTGFSSQGKMLLQEGEYASRGLRVTRMNAGAAFDLTPDKLSVSRLIVQAMGGLASGAVDIVHWRGSTPGGAEGHLRLQFRGWRVNRMLAAVATTSLPLDQLNAAGAASGLLEGRWRRSPADSTLTFSADLAAPVNSAPDELPVGGRVVGSYDHAGQSLRLTELNLAGRATRLTASGTLGGRAGNLAIVLEAHDLSESLRVLKLLRGPALPGVELHGGASLRGVLSGRLASPSLAAQLELTDFDLLSSVTSLASTVPAAAPPPSFRRTHWDTLTGGVEFSSARFVARHAALQSGAQRISFSASAALYDGRFAPDSAIRFRVTFHNAEVPNVLALAGYDYPLQGKLNGRFLLSGTRQNPEGDGTLAIADARFYGQPLQRISSTVRLARRVVELSDLQVSEAGAKLSGAVSYDLSRGGYQFNLRGKSVELAGLQWLRNPHFTFGGKLDFSANGQGTGAEPAINAELQLSGLTVNGEVFGGISAQAVTSGDTLSFSARGQGAGLTVKGSARLRGDYPAQAEVVFDKVDVNPLLGLYLRGRSTGASSLSGTVRVSGALSAPENLVLAGNLSDLSVAIEHIPLHNDGPIRFEFAHRSLQLQQLRIVGPDTSLSADGSLGLAGDRGLDLQAKGTVNLKLLESFDPTLIAYGVLTLDVRARGSLANPFISGRAELAHAALSQVDLPNGLSDLNGRMYFNEDRLRIQSLTGKTGGGTIEIGGTISYGRVLGFNLTAQGHDIRLRYAPGISAMGDAGLRLTGDYRAALLTGDITVTRFGINSDFDLANYLAKARQPAALTSSDSFINRVRMDVHVLSTPELQVQTSLAKVSGDVDLRLRGTGARPVLLGRINITEGDIYFNGTKYHMERGGVTFSNPVAIQPVLDLEATTSVRDYDITLGFHGQVDKLSTTYRSDPPLATADIISLLAFGRTREETAVQSAGASNLPPETQSILYQALNAAVSSRMQKLFGVSRIKIDPQAGGAANNPAGPRLTIEQQVANNLTLTYITDVARANYQTIQAEYNLNQNLSVVAVRDWNGVVSFDIRIRQRKK